MKTKASILLLSTSKLLNFQGLLGYPLNIKTSADNRFLFIMASKQGYKRESAKKDERCSYLDMIRCNGDFSASDFPTKTDKKSRGSSQLRVRGSVLDTMTQFNDISEECEIDIEESEQA